jgi:hypothetical protein
VKLLKRVWFDRTAVGRMTHSTPSAEMTGRAIVIEHLPRHEISCTVSILFIFYIPPEKLLSVPFYTASYYNTFYEIVLRCRTNKLCIM